MILPKVIVAPMQASFFTTMQHAMHIRGRGRQKLNKKIVLYSTFVAEWSAKSFRPIYCILFSRKNRKSHLCFRAIWPADALKSSFCWFRICSENKGSGILRILPVFVKMGCTYEFLSREISVGPSWFLGYFNLEGSVFLMNFSFG